MAEIYTTKGMMDDALLERTDGKLDNENEHTIWTEYRLNGEIVRRDVHVHLKKTIEQMMIQQELG